MVATLFAGWVYDFLKARVKDLIVAHPEMLKAIIAAKKKNDRADAEKICDLLKNTTGDRSIFYIKMENADATQ
jgi:transposase